jgi:hypothetical protein
MRTRGTQRSRGRTIVAAAAVALMCALPTASARAQTAHLTLAAASGPQLHEREMQPLWVCKGDLPPEGHAITATGPGRDCAGECNGLYAEPLRDQMVICQNQPVPDDFEVVGDATSPRCQCVAARQNALVIRRRIAEPQY